MPLIDDQTKGTDQSRNKSHRSKPYWPWVLTLVSFVVLWLASVTLVGVVPWLGYSPSAAIPVPSAQQQLQRSTVDQAQSALSNGSTATANQLIDQIPPDAAFDVMSKHTYLRTAAQVKRKSDEPAAAAAFYERFLLMGAGVAKAECQTCHSPGTVSPAKASDLETSTLGAEYVAALRAAGKLKSARKRLVGALKKQPKDAGTHLLLYHIEKALGDARAAAEQADALKAADSGD